MRGKLAAFTIQMAIRVRRRQVSFSVTSADIMEQTFEIEGGGLRAGLPNDAVGTWGLKAAGIPSSRLTIAACDVWPPSSVTMPFACFIIGT